MSYLGQGFFSWVKAWVFSTGNLCLDEIPDRKLALQALLNPLSSADPLDGPMLSIDEVKKMSKNFGELMGDVGSTDLNGMGEVSPT